MERTGTSVAAIVLASLLGASKAEPCDQVVVHATPRYALSHFNYVFAGKVVRSHSYMEWTVEPVRVWKGRWSGDPKQFRVENRQGMCGVSVAEGEYYLFYVNSEGGDIVQAGSLRDIRTQTDIGALDRARKRSPLLCRRRRSSLTGCPPIRAAGRGCSRRRSKRTSWPLTRSRSAASHRLRCHGTASTWTSTCS